MEVLFSPPPGIPARIAQAIDAALVSIFVCMYHFTESTLAQRMAAAVARGVDCRVILDYRSAYDVNSMSWQLAKTGVQVYTDNQHSILHSKYAIIDGNQILTGSANWSYNADGMAGEDFIVMFPGTPSAQAWIDNWAYHRSHSIPLPRS